MGEAGLGHSTSAVHGEFPMNIKTIARQATDKVIAYIKSNGSADWIRPWASMPAPVNAETERPYQGVLNSLLLTMTSLERGYRFPLWAGIKQTNKLGGSVRKGEKGTQVHWVRWLPSVDEDKTGNEQGTARKLRPVLGVHSVWNLDQTTLDAYSFAERIFGLEEHPGHERAEEFLNRLPFKVEWGGERAAYDPANDIVRMPHRVQFDSSSGLYSTWLHECAHATGHPTRLNRPQCGRFGSEEYSFEELVAELCSAYCCQLLEIDGKAQHEQYLASWLQKFESDPFYLIQASAGATKAAEYLLALSDANKNRPLAS